MKALRGTTRERLKTFVYYLLVGYLALVAIYSWFFAPPDHKPQAGDLCGPNHRWTYVGTPLNSDLSCEKSDN
jgi:hypothetical protein